MQSNLLIPYGRSKGEPIATCEMATLDWAINAVAKRLREEPGNKFAAKDRAWLDEAQRVFAERSEGVVVSGPGALAPPPQRQAAPLAVAPQTSELLAKVTLGALRDAKEASEALAKAAAFGHLISPQTVVGTLPEGCSLMVSSVVVDAARDTYPQAGSSERGLHKVALNKIASAAGIDWDPILSRRLDNGSHPHYRCCQAVGRVRQFDGTWRTQDALKEIDLREIGQDYLDIIAREEQKKRDEGQRYQGDGGAKEIAVKRKHILSLCDTEAKLRATRALVSLRVSYRPDELAKPFIVVRLVFDGRSENPETAKYFRERIADSFLGSSAALYGAPAAPAAAPQLRAAEPRIVELPEDEEWGPPDYGFADPPKATGTGGPY
jgi:hypothetical protein